MTLPAPSDATASTTPAAPPLRVLHLIDSLGVGGAERLVVRLAEASAGTRLDLSVATLRERSESPLAERVRRAGVPVLCLPLTHRERGGLRLAPRELARLVRFVRRGHFDVVHTHLNTADVLGPIVGRVAGVPVVSSQHSVGDGTTTVSGRERIRRFVLRHGTVEIIAVGDSVAEARRRPLAPRHITVVPNPAPEDLVPSAGARGRIRSELGIASDAVVALAAGRLEPAKDQAMLLEALGEVRRRGGEVVLLLAGDGTQRPALERRTTDLALGSHVRLLGARDDMADLFAAADLFVSSSRYEGMPLAVLEAMAAGLPVVATDVGDCRAVLGPAGRTTPPGDPRALAEAILTTLDPSVRTPMGTAARERAITRFGTAAWAANLAEVYERVAGAARP